MESRNRPFYLRQRARGEQECLSTRFQPRSHIIRTQGNRTSPCPELEETGIDTAPVFRSVQIAGRIPPSQRQWSEDQR